MKALMAILTAASLAMLAGCNTVEGFGQDVQSGGKAIERGADKTQDAMTRPK